MHRSQRKLLIGATSADSIRSFVLPLTPYLLDSGWRLTLVSHESVETPNAESIALPMSRSMSPLVDMRSLKDWMKILRDGQPDLVLVGSPKAGLLAMLAAQLLGFEKRVFQHWGARWETEQGWKKRTLMEADRITMHCATHVLAVSDSLADLVSAHHLARARPQVLGRGASTGVNRLRFTPRIDGPPQGPVYGFLGRLSRDKGIQQLIEAFRCIRQIQPEARLLVGGPLDAAQPIPARVLEILVSDPGVTWLGPVTDTPEFLRQLSVLLLPSMREGLPNVVIEAAACGVPTVGWDVTGVRDAVLSGVTGSLVKPGSSRDFAEAAVTWSTRASTAQASCREWSASFAEERVASNLVGFLDSVYRS